MARKKQRKESRIKEYSSLVPAWGDSPGVVEVCEFQPPVHSPLVCFVKTEISGLLIL